MLNHSYRTWAFGRALAEIDGVEVDDELLFAAAMLHDLGLMCPTYSRCFTAVGAEELLRLGRSVPSCSPSTVEAAADGITHHITPALTIRAAGPIGVYLQAGSLLDLTGVRVVNLPRDFVPRCLHRHVASAGCRCRVQGSVERGVGHGGGRSRSGASSLDASLGVFRDGSSPAVTCVRFDQTTCPVATDTRPAWRVAPAVPHRTSPILISSRA